MGAYSRNRVFVIMTLVFVAASCGGLNVASDDPCDWRNIDRPTRTKTYFDGHLKVIGPPFLDVETTNQRIRREYRDW